MIKKLKNLINTDNKKRLIENFFSLVVLKGFQFLIPLITLPYLVRTIGIENFGLVNFALSLGLYFGAIIQFGFGITATREIARHRDDPVKLAKIYSATLTASVLLALISAILFMAIVLSFEIFYKHLDLYLFTLAFIVFQSLFPIWFFQGMEKMKYITFLTLGTSTMFLLLLFHVVKLQDDFVYVPLLNAAAAFAALIISVVLIKNHFKVKMTKPSFKEITHLLKEGRHAFVIQLAPNFYNNSSVFLLGIFTSNSSVGIYTSALRVIEALMSVGQILTNTFLPYLSRDIKNHNTFGRVMFFSGLLLTISALLSSKWLAFFIYGEQNNDIQLIIMQLSPWIFLIFIRNALGVNYLMLVGFEKEYMDVVLYSSFLSCIIGLVAIPIYGIYGAVLVVNISATLMAIFTYKLYRNAKKLKC